MSKTYQETRVLLEKGEGDSKTIQVLKEAQFNELVAEAQKAGTPVPEPSATQTFLYHEAEGDVDQRTLVPLESERTNIFNRGLVLKQQTAIREIITDPNFQPVEGVYDLITACAEVRERRKATPEEKALKMLSSLSAEQVAQVMAALQKVQGAAA